MHIYMLMKKVGEGGAGQCRAGQDHDVSARPGLLPAVPQVGPLQEPPGRGRHSTGDQEAVRAGAVPWGPPGGVPVGSDPLLPAGCSPSCASSGIPAPARPCCCPRAMPRRGTGARPLPPSPRRRAESRGQYGSPLSQHTQPRRRTLPAVALKERSHIPPAHRSPRSHPRVLLSLGEAAPSRPGAGSPPPPTPPRAPDSKTQTWGNAVAPVVFGQRGQGSFGRMGGARSATHFSRLDCDLFSGLGAKSSHGCSSPARVRTREGTSPARNACPWHSHHPRICMAELALRGYWHPTYTLGGTKRPLEWGWSAVALWAGRGTRSRAGS